MITLTGVFRQSNEVTLKEKPMLKLVVEHQTARQDGTTDLHLETLFVGRDQSANLPLPGEEIQVEVRPYPKGRDVAYSATRVVAPVLADPLAVA